MTDMLNATSHMSQLLKYPTEMPLVYEHSVNVVYGALLHTHFK